MTWLAPFDSISLPDPVARLAVGAAGLALACSTFAGAPVVNPSNGHRYQVLDSPLTWRAAQAACANQGAHLVTIRDGDEEFFIEGLTTQFNQYWIGGSDYDVEGTIEWINGEPFAYSEPLKGSNDSGSDFLYLDPFWKGWYLSGESSTLKYICEWDDPGYVQLSLLPDVNGNGAPELLLVGTDPVRQQFIVTVKDSKKATELKTLHFGSDISNPPFGVVALTDTNGKGGAEIGVGYQDINAGTLTIEIKDNGNDKKVVRKLRLMTTDYLPLSMSASPDENGNGADEISVLARHRSGTPYRVDKIDSKSGELLSTMTF